MEKNRSVSLQLDGKKKKNPKIKKSKDITNGSVADGGEGTSGTTKEKCHVM